MGTAALLVEAVISFASLGLVLLPGVVLGIVASVFALEARRVGVHTPA